MEACLPELLQRDSSSCNCHLDRDTSTTCWRCPGGWRTARCRQWRRWKPLCSQTQQIQPEKGARGWEYVRWRDGVPSIIKCLTSADWLDIYWPDKRRGTGRQKLTGFQLQETKTGQQKLEWFILLFGQQRPARQDGWKRLNMEIPKSMSLHTGTNVFVLFFLSEPNLKMSILSNLDWFLAKIFIKLWA